MRYTSEQVLLDDIRPERDRLCAMLEERGPHKPAPPDSLLPDVSRSVSLT